MKNIQRLYAAMLLILLALWLIADPLLVQPYSFFGLRGSLVQGTGIVALGVMSVGMMLALRPVRIEPFLGGLDKMYRLHKWLGITALVVAVLHWLWAKAPKWLVGWGLLERPARQPRPEAESTPRGNPMATARHSASMASTPLLAARSRTRGPTGRW